LARKIHGLTLMNSSEPGVDLGSALTSLTYVRCPMGTLFFGRCPASSTSASPSSPAYARHT